MPKTVTKEQDLTRALEEGPTKGASQIEQDIKRLEKQQKYREQIARQAPPQKVRNAETEAIEAALKANVKNPYQEHKEADANNGASVSEIILETSQSVGIQNPFSNVDASPYPL